ncbi:unnamed protein product [Didymodactylos carnosus]|uniref:Reverse transcriptase domain-containing protein n=1 Tax=Didymodactylos carnosus TaxID=1234261 RepID=A0A8S2DRF9_9BILA|nr:unnamed protein product [Didymodactylos carnosus]CAF3761203.1 unnamed protein product [Didymodactylos carnosus]
MANNSQLHISGMVVLPITINNINTEINVFVIDDLCTDLLLGGDFCDKYNVNISYGGKYLTISTRQQQTRVKFQQQPNTQEVFHLKTLNDIAIPPLSSKVIQAASSSPPMSAIFTPSSRMTNKQYVIAPHAILTIDNTNTTILTLLNTTTSIKRIPQGTTLGQIKNHEDNTCCYHQSSYSNASTAPTDSILPISKLNLITERDVYPLPRIDDIIDKLADSQYFTTLDLKAGYWQIPIEEQDKKKTAFVTTEGLFEFNVLPFGLSNAPATFQRIINSVLGVLRWDITLVYLDDIIVYSPSFASHVKHLDLVLDALEKANVKLNAAKCSLARKQLDYLGYRITPDGIKPTRTNVKKTIDFPTPTSAKAAYSFIQMAQFYRRFIKDFSTIAAPLNMFKNKNIKFDWTPECEQAEISIHYVWH